MYVEKRKQGKWIPAQVFAEDDDGSIDVPYADKIYTDRNYDLFGFLAGVRNRVVKQHFKRKGFPKDASDEIKEIRDRWDVDGHSDSYLTLEDLLTVDWEGKQGDQMLTMTGIMDNTQWDAFEKTLKANKPNYDLITSYWQGGGDEKTSSYHEWQVPLSYRFKGFYQQVVQKLQQYDFTCAPHEIRIVFWFDN